MDYTKCFEKVILNYNFIDPIVEFIRHNENITYKVTEKGFEDTYLLRIHKPITQNMQGIQNTREAIQSELEYLLALSSQSEFPVQIPVPNISGEIVTGIFIESQEVYCSVLRWIAGETMSKIDFTNEEMVSTLGKRIAHLHQFSRSFKSGLNFIRPHYELEWINKILTKFRSGENIGIITTEEFKLLENTISLATDRIKRLSKGPETWGFIHADIHYSNLISTPSGISFIDFGLSGFGYYAMDVASAALFTNSELRDNLLSAYTNIISRKIDIAQLEDFMFLEICGLYAFRVSNEEMHIWIREHIPSLIELCKSLLNGKMVFNKMNQVGLAI